MPAVSSPPHLDGSDERQEEVSLAVHVPYALHRLEGLPGLSEDADLDLVSWLDPEEGVLRGDRVGRKPEEYRSQEEERADPRKVGRGTPPPVQRTLTRHGAGSLPPREVSVQAGSRLGWPARSVTEGLPLVERNRVEPVARLRAHPPNPHSGSVRTRCAERSGSTRSCCVMETFDARYPTC